MLVKNIATANQGHLSEDLVKGALKESNKVLHYFFDFGFKLQNVLAP